MSKAAYHQYLHQGLAVHLLRRTIHLSSLFILWVYYQFGSKIANYFEIKTSTFIIICLMLILILEALRLSMGWIIFGQRHYEQTRLSAFAWGAVGMALVLLLAPEPKFAVPIIGAYAIGDPLLGELRRAQFPKIVVMIIGILVITGIWLCSHFWFGTPMWLAFLMGPLTVLAEWPCFNWIDDNALMQLVPLAVTLLLPA